MEVSPNCKILFSKICIMQDGYRLLSFLSRLPPRSSGLQGQTDLVFWWRVTTIPFFVYMTLWSITLDSNKMALGFAALQLELRGLSYAALGFFSIILWFCPFKQRIWSESVPDPKPKPAILFIISPYIGLLVETGYHKANPTLPLFP